mmetsp:Transcript_78204/g.172581  ORF Transcript_78204/g.172581 Transcript_78204/m.172581 type:complete len:210 (+) Transcript_78204:2591-3220(+)
MPEGHWKQGLCVDPPVRDHSDEVLWRQRLSDGHREVQGMLLLSTSFLQHEHLLVQNLLSIHILHKNPEGLGAAMDLWIPLEVRCDGQLHHETGASDGLDIGTQVQLWELVNQLVDGFAHLWEANQLTNLRTGEIVVALPCKVLLLHLPQDIFGQTLEVTQRRLTGPHPLVDHLAPIQGPQGQRCPASSQTDLKDRTHDSSGRLLNIDHV